MNQTNPILRKATDEQIDAIIDGADAANDKDLARAGRDEIKRRYAIDQRRASKRRFL